MDKKIVTGTNSIPLFTSNLTIVKGSNWTKVKGLDLNKANTTFNVTFSTATSTSGALTSTALTSMTNAVVTNTNLKGMFCNDTNLTTVSLSGTANTDCSYMFHNCSKLASIYAYCPSAVSAVSMFYNCTSITQLHSAQFISSGLQYAQSAFMNCTSLNYLSQGSWSNLKNADYVFYNCKSLTGCATGYAFKWTGCTSLKYAFYNCSGMSEIQVWGNWTSSSTCETVLTGTSLAGVCYNTNTTYFVGFDVSNVTDFTNAFTNTPKLRILGIKGLKANLDLSSTGIGYAADGTTVTAYWIKYIYDNANSVSGKTIKFPLWCKTNASVSGYCNLFTGKGWTVTYA